MTEKYRVLVGSVRVGKCEVKTGDIAGLSEKDGKELVRLGLVEVYVKEVKPKKVVEKPKEVVIEEVVEEVVPEIEPTMDWTRLELNECAISKGVENPELLPNKKAVFNAIKEAK